MKTGLRISGASLLQFVSRWSAVLPATVLLAACGASPGDGNRDSAETLGSTGQALTGEDGLAEGFATFKETFVNFGFDRNFSIGYAFHPGLSTEKLTGAGHPPKGTATLNFANQSVNAVLDDVPAGVNFDL